MVRVMICTLINEKVVKAHVVVHILYYESAGTKVVKGFSYIIHIPFMYLVV